MTALATNTTQDCTVSNLNKYDPKLFPLFVAVNVLCFFASALGNSILLFVIYKKECLRTTSNLLMCSLASTDLVTGLMAIPLHITVERLWVKKMLDSLPLVSKLQIFFVYFATSGSTLNMCAMSIDRYIAVQRPLRYAIIMTRRRLVGTVTLVWIINLSFALVGFLYDSVKSFSFQLTRIILILGIPLIVILYCYVKIFWISKRQIKRTSEVHPAFEMNSNGRSFAQRLSSVLRNRKYVVTLGIITIVFLISYLPSMLLSILHYAVKECVFRSIIQESWMWSVLFMYSSCALNPLVYGARNREIREAVKKMMTLGDN